ncbi:MAG: DNA/RNA nuclease SfsA [Oscillospiraceae bacterium]|nr:DNA/RNA nuclease SfsA [Oscillospiraceae bacterium]
MKYENVISGKFISRPNRFIAHVEIEGKEEICHVMNTGRMKELLLPGAEVFLCPAKNPERKTGFDLIGVRRADGEIINIDSIAPNKVAGEYIPTLFPGVKSVKPEKFFEKSRFDFYIEDKTDKIFLEVKGVTLNMEGEARFPDAPTERGAKHLCELIEAKRRGFRACVLFVIAMKGCKSFAANSKTDPGFAEALCKAHKNGVEIFAVDCLVTAEEIIADKPVPVRFCE